ncbi:MAG: hypothetical protein ACXVAU_02590 [Mucilaginibacter sp.]
MKLFFIALLTVLPFAIFAQSNYHEGYVLKNNGDTLKGFIDYREWDRTPKSIDFKTSKDSKEVLQFTPQTIRGFQITGMENYLSYTGLISMDRTRFPDLPDGLDTGKQQASIFLKQLATGSYITLFYHNDEKKARFFIAEKNGPPVELVYHQYYTNEKDIHEMPVYRGQLILYINKFNTGDKELLDKVGRVMYKETDLEQIVNEINGNDVKKTQNKKSNTRFFVGAGINNTQTQYYQADFQSPLSSATITPKISGGLDVFVNPNVQQFIFRVELSFSYIKTRFIYPVSSSGPFDIYSFNQYTASVTPQLLYNIYNKDNFKVYLDGGLAFNFSSYSNASTINPAAGAIDPNQQPYHLEPYWANFPVQAGVVINKKIEISFTYAAYAAYTQYQGLSIANRSACLGVKYLLSKH